MKIGIYTIVPHPEVANNAFEQIMITEVFPSAANTPGTVNRIGHSAIESQHLLRNEQDKRIYSWLIKDNEVLSSRSTQEILQSMYITVQDKLDAVASIKSTTILSVTNSFNIGERDSLGRPIGLPIVGSNL